MTAAPEVYQPRATYESPATYEPPATYESPATYEPPATYESPATYEPPASYEPPATHEPPAAHTALPTPPAPAAAPVAPQPPPPENLQREAERAQHEHALQQLRHEASAARERVEELARENAVLARDLDRALRELETTDADRTRVAREHSQLVGEMVLLRAQAEAGQDLRARAAELERENERLASLSGGADELRSRVAELERALEQSVAAREAAERGQLRAVDLERHVAELESAA